MVRSRSRSAAIPHRDDCWSEGSTSTLIDAWGVRYLEVSRGHLRRKQWQEVADAVNSRRRAVGRPPRSDIQCKNRIDTIKKKYKAEKARIAGSGGNVTSGWPFYSSLETLIGSRSGSAKKPSPPAKLSGVEALASAILGFGEMYERVEVSKQKAMVELEKRRMEFDKEVEFRRLQMFVESQVKLRKMSSDDDDGEESGISGIDLVNLQLIKMLC